MRKASGFTLIEILIVILIIAITAVSGSTYLLGTQEKSILISQQDKIVATFEFARQQSISAFKGYSYKVIIYPDTREFIMSPEGKNAILDDSITIEEPLVQTEVEFEKISGKPDKPLTIVLSSARFQTSLRILDSGTIETNELVRK